MLLVGGTERDNTEDSEFARALTSAHGRLQSAIPPAVHRAKAVALGDLKQAPAWRQANAEVNRRWLMDIRTVNMLAPLLQLID